MVALKRLRLGSKVCREKEILFFIISLFVYEWQVDELVIQLRPFLAQALRRGEGYSTSVAPDSFQVT